MKKIYLSILLVFCFISTFSQETCGTNITPQDLESFDRMQDQIRNLETKFLSRSDIEKTTALPAMVPVKVHFVRTSDGMSGLTTEELIEAFDMLNQNFVQAELEFFICGEINYIDDDALYDFETNDESYLRSGNQVDDVINLYFVNTIVRSSDNLGLCGYAYFPTHNNPNETILMRYGCTVNSHVLSHEFGHFYGLPHTHGFSNSELTDELVNGNNCNTAGDRICDTPADPLLTGLNLNQDCVFIGTETDINGHVFDPDPYNIMSYAPFGCPDIFTPQQYAKMNSVARIFRSHLRCPEFYPDFVADKTDGCESTLTVNFTDTSVGATSWAWDINGDNVIDYTTQNVTHTYVGQETFDVSLFISNGIDTLFATKENYIDVGPTEIIDTQIKMTLTFDEVPSDIRWEFRDENNTLLYFGDEYADDEYANTTIEEIFDVELDKCYSFIIEDKSEDGLCCLQGSGGYTLNGMSGGFGNTAVAGSIFEARAQEVIYTGNVLSNAEFTESLVSLYPNPAEDRIQISVPNQLIPKSYTIYNTLGQEIRRKIILSETDLEIDLNGLSEGVYYLKLTRDVASVTVTFIRN